MPIRHVVLVTEQTATSSAVGTALSNNGQLLSEDICRGLAELVERLEKGPAPAVIVDIDGQPRMLASLEPVIRRFPDSRFVLLSSQMQPAVLLEAMQIGARHFLLKQAISDELLAVLHRLCPPAAPGRAGSVITIFSAGGGCGATTVAVNIANELQLRVAEPALVVDLDCAYSTVPSYLSLNGQFGLLDLLARTGPIDSELIRSTALETTGNLHVLSTTATTRLAAGPLEASPRLEEAIEACRSAYAFTVIDAPRVGIDVASLLAKASDTVLVVMQLTIKDLRVAKLMLQRLLDDGVGQSKLQAVIGRFRRRASMIEPEEAQRVLGQPSVIYLSNDFPSASQAIDLGQPLAQAAPRSPLRREIQALAAIMLDKQLAPASLRPVAR